MKWIVPALTAAGVAALSASPTRILIWNASASAPLGLYVLHRADSLARGDLVLAEPPTDARNLAATRGYLPAGVPLVKRIAALSGDTICSFGKHVAINGRIVAKRLAADTQGRPLPAWHGCYRLKRGDAFLLMAHVPDSFDGRYFGLVRREATLGILRPLWTH